MIFRLEYKNRNGLQARLDITTPDSSIVKEIEGTEQPFLLSYKGDKNDKSLNFLTSSAEINIYETPDFNIDNLKTSNETQIKVDYYIDSSKYWTGFVIPDFFSREIGGAGVVSMVASDRLSTLKGVTLSDLPSMVSIRELAVQCLAKTGLDLPLKTMADFQHGSNIDGFFTSQIASQRLTDNKGRSISCYDVLKSILVASNSRLEQSGGEWRITNKLQHELGTGRLYSGNSTFTNYLESVFNFNEITKGAMRSIVPVAGSVGIYHEHGGGKKYPSNYDFSDGLDGWVADDEFIAAIENRHFDKYISSGTSYVPDYSNIITNNYLVNKNYRYFDVPGRAGQPRLSAKNIPIISSNPKEVNIEFDINATGKNKTYLFLSISLYTGTKTLFLNNSGAFQSIFYVIEMPFNDGSKGDFEAIAKGALYKAAVSAEENQEVTDYTIELNIYGSGAKTSYSGEILFDTTVIINSISVKCSSTSGEIPKGNIFKTEQGANYTKSQDVETTIFGDYLTGGLNGYFYDYPIDDTSSLYQGGELTSLWATPFVAGEAGEFNLLHHSVRQKRRMFSVAHDLISGEIEMEMFDPLSIFVDCDGKRHVVVSAEVDFLRSNVKIEIEEIAYRNLIVRDFIYSYFGDGESGISSVGGIQAGSGGGGSGGWMTPDQINILNNLASWWKLDDDGNLFTELNVYSEKEVSAFGVGSGGSGGGGSDVSWGTQYTTQAIELTVEGTKKILSLSSHVHDVYSITGLANALDNKQNKLIAGTGITISGNTISATGGGGGSTVTWGTTSNNYSPLTVEGVTKTVALSGHTHAWGDVTGKPSTFTPSAHTHAWGDITGKPSTFAPSAHTHAWGDITGIPSTFAPSAHTHPFTEITGTATTSQIPSLPASKITSGTFDIARIPTGTTSSTVALGNHTHTFTEITGTATTAQIPNLPASKITSGTFDIARIPTGTTSSTVALGNDSRIVNGQTAYDWGNHASAGYALSSALSNYVPTSRTVTAGNGLTGGGALSSNITLTLGTPGTLTAATTNSVTASSHTHNITTTTVGASNTIVQTDSTGAIRGNSLKVGAEWSFELSGNELQIKRNNVLTHRLLADGSFVGTGEITAYGSGAGGESVALQRSGGTMTGDLILDANLGASNKALKLLGNSFKYNNSNVLTEANTANNLTTNKITLGNGWTIEQTSSSLTIRKNGVIKETFNA